MTAPLAIARQDEEALLQALWKITAAGMPEELCVYLVRLVYQHRAKQKAEKNLQ